MKLAPGHTFGRYLIEAFIGQGGMGRVFRAQDTLLERPVALKVILPDQAKDPEAVPRFFREAKLAAKLTHPNTVHLYDLGEVEGVPFMAMELIAGRSLQTFIGDTTIASDRKLRWMLGVARGLAAAHERGLVHRDVKPANVMVSSTDDLAKIVDFGLAKRLATTPALRTTFQTQSGFVLGTPAYMAPEALAGHDPHAKQDQFGWAITTHTVVAGQNPRARDPMLERPIAMLSDILPAVSRRAALVIIRALSIDPAMRFRTMGELADALAEAILVGTLAPPPPPPRAALRAIPPGSIPPIVPRSIAPKPTVAILPGPASVPPPVSAPPPAAARTTEDQERLVLEARAREQVDRMRLANARALDAVKRGVTSHKQHAALVGSPAPGDIEGERWSFRPMTPRSPAARLRLAAIAPDGRDVFAVSARGAEQTALSLRGESWVPFAFDDLAPGMIECARILSDGRIAIGGWGAFAAIASFDGRLEPWELRGQRGHVVVDLRSTGDRSFSNAIFTAVDARVIGGELELGFVGHRASHGVAAVGRRGWLTAVASPSCGPLVGIVLGKIAVVAGTDKLGIYTELGGIEDAVHSDQATSLVRIDPYSALSLGASGFVYFDPLDAATWPELSVGLNARPVIAAAADRTEIYAIDRDGALMRRSASWTWGHPRTDFRVREPIAMWAGPGALRIVCADGTVVTAERRG